ncbi:hypothetical protein AQ436_01695 [Arthrobacter sp. EpRS66]|nr:hypothetical protein AQ436_01695 [Arthrobacter sp. EpRS66]
MEGSGIKYRAVPESEQIPGIDLGKRKTTKLFSFVAQTEGFATWRFQSIRYLGVYMKKFMKQFEGLRLTERGDTMFVLMIGVLFFGTLVAADFIGSVA